MKKYTKIETFQNRPDSNSIGDLNTLIIGLHQSNETPWKSHKLSNDELQWLQRINNMPGLEVVTVGFVNPYSMTDVLEVAQVDAQLLAYQNSDLAQLYAAQALFGAFAIKGKLPADLNDTYKSGVGLETVALARLGFEHPDKMGFDVAKLQKVDSLVVSGINDMMFPGAQVLIAKEGKVVYNKAFGKIRYKKSDSITTEHMYDLASLTKILSTLPLLMRLRKRTAYNLIILSKHCCQN